MPDRVYGPLVTGGDVEGWALATLRRWLPAYLGWAERVRGRRDGSLPLPRSWRTAASMEEWPEDVLPALLLLSTGITGEPRREGRGRYTAEFGLGVAVVVSDRDESGALDLAKLYAAVVRALLVQNRSLDGHALAVDWVDERYDVMPGVARTRRQLAAGQVVFRVGVEVVVARGGPLSPPIDPHEPVPDLPVVRRAEVELTPRGLT